MRIRFILGLLAILFSWPSVAQLTIIVTHIPTNTPVTDDIYIAGNFQNWNPGDANYVLTGNGDGTYQITITPPVGLVKYKFTRGDWSTVEGNAGGGFLPDREFNYNGTSATEEVEILSWEDLGGSGGNSTAAENVHILDDNFYMPQLDRYRRVWIYLPPDYDSSTKYYPVLYMHDGQNVFDAATSFAGEWEVDESLNELFGQGDYGCIVVAVDNGQTLRTSEYSPWVNTTYNDGGEGADYMDFIAGTLKPYIDGNYRTLTGRDYTGIMGSSLGGLISHFGILAHQDVFSKAGIFSPAYWFNPEIYTFTDDTPKTAPMKLYLLAGEQVGNGSVVDDVNQMEDLLFNNGFGTNEVEKVFHADGEHSEWYWAREFAAAYEWLFGELDLTAASEAKTRNISFYPNPADSVLYITNTEDLKRPSYRIYSMEGNLLIKGKLEGIFINLGELPSGPYTLQILSKHKIVFSDKVIVNN
ncbi:MAG: alpha/beta hydrolase-fold protein [Saprospiraceae bacterium]